MSGFKLSTSRVASALGLGTINGVIAILSGKMICGLLAVLIIVTALLMPQRLLRSKFVLVFVILLQAMVLMPIDLAIRKGDTLGIKWLSVVEGTAVFDRIKKRIESGEVENLDFIVLQRHAFISKTRWCLVLFYK